MKYIHRHFFKRYELIQDFYRLPIYSFLYKKEKDSIIYRLGNMLWQEDDTILKDFLKESKTHNLKRKV